MPWNRVVLVATVLLTLTTVPVVGVPQCKEGPVYRDGIEMYTGSGVLDGSSVKNKDCESGECGMSLYLLDENTEKKIYAAFFCGRSKRNLTRNWIKSPNERVALFYCTDDTNPDSRPCNDPSLIFDVDGEEKKKNEDELRQIGIIINDRATVDISTTPVAVEGTPSEAPDAEGDSDVVTEKEADTPVPESVEIAATDETLSDAPDNTVDSITTIGTEKETDTTTPESTETYDDYEEQTPPGKAEIPATPAAIAPNVQQDGIENKTADEAAAPAATNKEAIVVTSSESPRVVDATQPSSHPIENETDARDEESSSVTDAAPATSDPTDEEHSEGTPASEPTFPETNDSADTAMVPAPGNAAIQDAAASPSVSAAAAATGAPNAAAATGLTLAGVTLLTVISSV